MTKSKIIRTSIAIIASIGVLFVLDLMPWKIDVARLSETRLCFGLAANAANHLIFAAFVGAFIARSNFLGPAMFIAILVWALTLSFIDAVQIFEPDVEFSRNTGVSLIVLVFAIGGAILGALLGQRLATPDEGRPADVA